MGTIRCTTSHAGRQINGVILGEPAAPSFYTYDDALIPSGLLLDDGTLIPIEVVPDETPQGNANRETIKAQALTALAENRLFIQDASVAQAEAVVQVRALSRQMNGVIRLLLGQLDDVN